MTTTSDSPDLGSLLRKLTLEQKVSLLAAIDWWRTPTIKNDVVYVPHIKATDGPNGARGESYVSGIKAACFPCGTSLGASFDPDLVFRAGKEIALEAKTKAANIVLAPTLNVVRSPRGGRNYETFSEDPLVLGLLAAAFVNGCQSEGIAATPKHYVANDTENNRKVLTAEIDEQTLREIYMLPFQLVLRHSDPWCLMTSYNRVNGTYVADDARLVNGVLRGEWSFKGLVVSDWMGVYSTADCINAGVDLEMPGPTKLRGEKLMEAIQNGQVLENTVNDSVMRVLQLAQKTDRFENPAEAPEKVTINTERDDFIKDAGAKGMVLLKNEGILPIPMASTVAVIGYHAFHASLGGGGSARVDAIRAVSPAEGMRAAGYRILESPGVPVFGALPHADPSTLLDSVTNDRCAQPVRLEWFNGHVIGQGLVHTEAKALPEYMIKEKWPSFLNQNYCSKMAFTVQPSTTGNHILSVISTGPAICYINGEVAYNRPQETDLNPESFYFFKSKIEHRFTYHMEADTRYALELHSWNTDPRLLHAKPLNGRMFQGSSLRFHEAIDEHRLIQDACEVAKDADYAVVCVGTTSEIESEGFDRDTMDLSPAQYEQIMEVSAHNPRTVVVNFTGSPVTMTSFINHVPGLIQGWFPGQECGHSLALVLSGKVNPSGRLPFIWPRKDEDNPTWSNFPCDGNNIVRYEERLAVGYRYYDQSEAPQPLFPFGFGLSYTQFEIQNAHLHSLELPTAEDYIDISLDLHNVGLRDGSTIIQVYVQFPETDIGAKRPVKELKAFQKVETASGEVKEVVLRLDKYSASLYNAQNGCWQANKGNYVVHIGFSSAHICQRLGFIIPSTFTWTGI